jgi:hypothetical protein
LLNGTSGRIGGSITSSDSSISSFEFTGCPPGLIKRAVTNAFDVDQSSGSRVTVNSFVGVAEGVPAMVPDGVPAVGADGAAMARGGARVGASFEMPPFVAARLWNFLKFWKPAESCCEKSNESLPVSNASSGLRFLNQGNFWSSEAGSGGKIFEVTGVSATE